MALKKFKDVVVGECIYNVKPAWDNNGINKIDQFRVTSIEVDPFIPVNVVMHVIDESVPGNLATNLSFNMNACEDEKDNMWIFAGLDAVKREFELSDGQVECWLEGEEENDSEPADDCNETYDGPYSEDGSPAQPLTVNSGMSTNNVMHRELTPEMLSSHKEPDYNVENCDMYIEEFKKFLDDDHIKSLEDPQEVKETHARMFAINTVINASIRRGDVHFLEHHSEGHDINGVDVKKGDVVIMIDQGWYGECSKPRFIVENCDNEYLVAGEAIYDSDNAENDKVVYYKIFID